MSLKCRLYQNCIKVYIALARYIKTKQEYPKIDLQGINNILIIHPQRIGDFINAYINQGPEPNAP